VLRSHSSALWNRRLFSIMASSFSLLLVAVFGAFFGVASFFIYLFTPPRHFPKNIPTIPFYYALLPLFFDVDQAENYKRYLKEYVNFGYEVGGMRNATV
jgi:hypothetical protein